MATQRSRVVRPVELRETPRPGGGEVLRQLDGLARVSDDLVRVPGLGWRVGIDPLIGLIPGLGDITSTVMAVTILIGAAYVGVPKVTLLRMGMNVALDLIIGAIPFVGDAFDIWFRANQRNMAILHARMPAADRVVRRADLSDWAFVIAIIAVLIALLFAVFWFITWLLSQLGRLIFG
jgi:hypothetical protein